MQQAIYPRIIQGGMGVAVSAWPLARAVSLRGELGVVSGTGIDVVMARRLQLGDVGGHIAEALAHFPIPEMAARVWDKYFVHGGKAPDAPYKSKAVPSINPAQSAVDSMVVANFVEVFLAKRGHNGLVGINLLEKIQLPTIPSLFGAMLAGVDYVIMGAGIPRAIPAILDKLAMREPTELEIDVTGLEPGEKATIPFDPTPYGDTPLTRPKFLAIVSSTLLATVLARKIVRPVDGFVIEGFSAGGHNAPPRGDVRLSEEGEPIYGEKDIPDLSRIRDLGLPFWLAGSYGAPGKLEEAQAMGAEGIQVGTAFAFCEESGIRPDIRHRVIRRSVEGAVTVFTDPKASPTGFPIKILQDEETLSTKQNYEKRTRICDMGYLREVYKKPDGKIGYRCGSEPLDDYVMKGGDIAETVGRKCICNGLLTTVGLGQIQKGGVAELPIVTAGDDVANVCRYLKPGQDTYTADDVIDLLLSPANAKSPELLECAR